MYKILGDKTFFKRNLKFAAYTSRDGFRRRFFVLTYSLFPFDAVRYSLLLGMTKSFENNLGALLMCVTPLTPLKGFASSDLLVSSLTVESWIPFVRWNSKPAFVLEKELRGAPASVVGNCIVDTVEVIQRSGQHQLDNFGFGDLRTI